MTQSTYPTLPTSPLGIGDLLGASLKLFARRWPLYVLLAVISSLAVSVVAVAVVGVAATEGVLAAGRGMGIGPVLLLIAGGIAIVLVVQTLVSLYCSSVAVGLAEGSAWGQTRSWGQATARVRGVVGRIGWVQVALALVGALLIVGMLAGFLVALFKIITIAADGSTPSQEQTGAILAGLLLFIVLCLLSVPVLLVWQTKFAFIIPIAALEHDRTGVAVYRQSWRMTKGHFWRILGFMLLAGLIVGALLSVLGQVLSGFSTPLVSAFDAQTGEYNGIAGVSWLVLVISQLLYGLVSSVAGVLMTLFVFVLYVDTDRRNRGEVLQPFRV